jgi:hypothetical protein
MDNLPGHLAYSGHAQNWNPEPAPQLSALAREAHEQAGHHGPRFSVLAASRDGGQLTCGWRADRAASAESHPPEFHHRRAWMAKEFLQNNGNAAQNAFTPALHGISLSCEKHIEFKKRVPQAIGLIHTGSRRNMRT